MMGFHLLSKSNALALVVAPNTLSKTGPNGSLQSDLATAIPSGGLAPFTFAWSIVSGDVYNINTPTADNTTFNSTGTNEAQSGNYKCIVTDDNGDTAQDQVQVNFIFGTPP